MDDPPAVDVAVLRGEVQRHYAEEATTPAADFHFHTGRSAAKQVGYGDDLLRGLPEAAVEAFAGVANPFHFGLPAPGENVLDILVDVEFGPLVDTYAGASGEGNARLFGTFGYPFRARRPDE